MDIVTEHQDMEEHVRRAARNGNSGHILGQLSKPFSRYRTLGGNTIIHTHLDGLALEQFIIDMIRHDSSLVDARDYNGENLPCHLAAKSGQYVALEALIVHGGRGQILMTNKGGNTALHEACRAGKSKAVDLLLRDEYLQFVDKYTANNAGETPLHLAVLIMSDDIVKSLLQRINKFDEMSNINFIDDNAKIGCALHSAVSMERSDYVRQIATELPELVKFGDFNGQTPLHYAAKHGWTEGVSILANKNSSAIICRDNDKKTAAHIAAEKNKIEVVEKLMELRSDIHEAIDINDQNALHRAAACGSGEVFSYFLKHDFILELIDKRDNNGDTPVHLFADSIPGFSSESVKSMQHNKVIPQLKEYLKSNPPSFNNNNCTPGDIIAAHHPYELKGPNRNLLESFKAVAPTSNRKKDLQKGQIRNNVVADKKSKVTASRPREELTCLLTISFIFVGVCFQAGMSVPGGFNQNDTKTDPINGGTSILVSKIPFQAFISLNSYVLFASSIEALLYAIVWHFRGEGVWTNVFTWTSRSTWLSGALCVSSYYASVLSTTSNCDFCKSIVTVLFSSFVVAYIGFGGWAVCYNHIREKAKLRMD